MVRRKHKHRVVKLARLLKALEKIAKCIFKLEVAGNIRLYRLRIIKLGNLLTVAVAHRVGVERIAVVAAEGHVIGVELLLVYIIVNRLLHHFKVARRPRRCKAHSVTHCFKGCVAHVRVGGTAAVIRG